jgi:hypothetical protein
VNDAENVAMLEKAHAKSAPSAPRRPRRCTQTELAHAGVQLIYSAGIWLSCMYCGRTWSPNLRTGGHLPRGYWICPDGCNDVRGLHGAGTE